MNKKIIIRLIVVLILVGTGVFIYLNFYSKAFEYAGTVEATRVDLPSRVATIVKEIKVEEGQSVKKGDVLAILSCEDVNLAFTLAKDNYNRAVNLNRAGSISKEAFDLSKNKKDDAETRMGWCQVTSPVDGTILDKYLEPGEWVNPGTKILTLANLYDLYAYFYVPQNVMSELKIGSKVIADVPELNKKFEGTITKINNEAEFTPKNVQTQAERTRLVFGIKVGFKNEENLLKPGMTLQSTLKN